MILGKTKKLLEDKKKSFLLPLQNNYKEEAYRCWKEYEAFIMELKREGKINDKDYQKLIEDVNQYKSTFAKIRR